MRAAGLSETVRSAVRALSVVSASPSEILSHVNRMLLRQESEQFVTALLLIIDPSVADPRRQRRAPTRHPSAGRRHKPIGGLRAPAGHLRLGVRRDRLPAAAGRLPARLHGRRQRSASRRRALRPGAHHRRWRAGATAGGIARAVRDAALEFGGRLRDDLQIIVIGSWSAPGCTEAASYRAPLRTAFACDPQRLLETRHAVRDFLAARGVDEQTVEELVLCVEEACTNTLRHSGNRSRARSRCRYQEHVVEICVKDSGKGLDLARIDLAREPDLLALGGRGLYLIKALADELELANEGGACVRIRKRLAPPTQS